MPQPFEATPDQLAADPEPFVDAVYGSLESASLVLPRGPGFVAYPRFNEAYETLKRETRGFRDLREDTVWATLQADSLALVVLRAILGMTPPEWAALASLETGVVVPQNAARSFDQRARTQPDFVANARGVQTIARLRALVRVACAALTAGAPAAEPDTIHRLDKVDTAQGLPSVQRAADLHVPYAMLLYERFLGRPFASHRDSVSELIGDEMELALDTLLGNAGISHRRTRRAERLPGFAQAPDFMIPDEVDTRIVIEAKITNDDGTARDKFARLHRLAQTSDDRIRAGQPGFQVIACLDGRGFGVRREDMRQLLLRLHGKVFTFRTLDHLIAYTDLARYVTKP